MESGNSLRPSSHHCQKWKDLLQEWSTAILKYPERRATLPPEAVRLKRGWIGYPPATEKQLKSEESRLGIPLPRSYITFLAVTNGWPAPGPMTDALLSVEDIDWFSLKSCVWLESWRLGASYYGGPMPVKDEEYFVYGEDQNPLLIRDEYLDTALQISDGGIAYYLLNPKIIYKNGEWEAWIFESETGAQRFKSFWHLMVAEYESFLQLKDL